MRLFLDTDVLIDVAIDRQPFSRSAAGLLDHLQSVHESNLAGYLSWSSFLEFSQKVAPLMGPNNTAEFCTDLCSFIRIAHVKGADLNAARAFNLPDFRGTLQAAAAIACKADLIITSNLSQYSGLRIPVNSPAVFLESAGKGENSHG